MKQIFTGFSLIGAVVLVAMAVGCTSTQTQTQSKENLLVAAGFKVIVPRTAKQFGPPPYLLSPSLRKQPQFVSRCSIQLIGCLRTQPYWL